MQPQPPNAVPSAWPLHWRGLYDAKPGAAVAEGSVAGRELSRVADQLGRQGVVPIIMAFESGGGYTLLGQQTAGAVETQMEQTSGSGLGATVGDLGQRGFVITSMVSNSAGYTLAAAKRPGARPALKSEVLQVPGRALDSAVADLNGRGMVVVAMATNSAGYTLIGQGLGSVMGKVAQISGRELQTAVREFSEAGYVITTAVTNSAGYTFIGQKSPDGPALVGDVAQEPGFGLRRALDEFTQQALVITAVMGNSAGYTVIAQRPKP